MIEGKMPDDNTLGKSDDNELNNEYYLDTLEDIYGALRKIVSMQQPVFIKIDGSDESFTSDITEVNLKNSSFYLDEVVPESGNNLIRSGHRFSVVADSRGIKIEFNMTGRLKYQPEKQRYRVEFPTQLLYLQRRTAYRVMIPPAHQILIQLKMEDGGENISGKLADLSSSGFKALFEGDHVERLQAAKYISIARIKFNEQHSLDCSLEARHVIPTKEGKTQVGFAFTMISGTGQRYIDRLIGELQWEERHHAEMEELAKKENVESPQEPPKIQE